MLAVAIARPHSPLPADADRSGGPLSSTMPALAVTPKSTLILKRVKRLVPSGWRVGWLGNEQITGPKLLTGRECLA
jgi:hypothetical protein